MKSSFSKLTSFKKNKPDSFSEKIILIGSLSELKPAKLKASLPKTLYDRVSSALEARGEDLKIDQSLMVPPSKKGEPTVHLASLPKNQSLFSLLGFAKSQFKDCLSHSTKSLSLVILHRKLESELSESFGAALATRVFLMPVYGKKAKEQKTYNIKTFELVSAGDCRQNFQYGFETGHGTNLVRKLGFMPSNILSSATYAQEIKKLAKEHKLQLKFYSKADLKKLKAGAFLAVDQGDPDSKGGIYELTYSAKSAKNKKPVVLVGKGLCFDTGGYDIKTQGYMANMKGDMQGSAVALSGICTAARLKLPIKMKAFLGVTENHISPKAYKADDVVVSMNGTAIEIVNTDAEGRMVLADTITLASKAKPDVMVDFATLTGAAVYSLGSAYSAGFTNVDSMHSKIVDAGKKSGERVWTFPMDEDYGKGLETSIADTLQCSRARGGDHILAALFLSKFLEGDFPWIHIDLSAAEKKGGLAHVDTEYTGFGVRWLLEFLRQKYKVR